MENVTTGKVGKYELIRVLGRGGMGEVLLARDLDLDRRVAIKRPLKSAMADGLARFQVEAKAATLRHPNIPAVYEMGVQDGLPFIAMEFVEGEGLDKIIDSGKQLDLITKLGIIEQVCSALSYAHEKGIIHRDIKPANIIVQPDGVAKIIDFGIAKIQADEKTGLTQTAQVIGSLHYIAPERFKPGPIDGRVDIFSAGVTLFKLLTGEEPFTGGESTASYKIVNEAATPLATYLRDYPPELDEIIAKSLAKNPDDRYATGDDFADALHEVIEVLKRSRVSELFSDAERLATERRFSPALELLEEAVRLDPANTQVRKLRKFVREHQERLRRAERIRECTARADIALLSGSFEEALAELKEAQSFDITSAEIRERIRLVEDKKRRHERTTLALGESEAARQRGDITAALRIVAKALVDDPDHEKLVASHAALTKQAEIETQRSRILEILDLARKELEARNLDAAESLLGEAESIDVQYPETESLRGELTRFKEQEQRREALEEIHARVKEFIKTESYIQATELLDRAIAKLPNEALLHRLKAEVDAESQRAEARRFVEGAISRAEELFSSSPFEALAVLQNALDKMPGNEQLLSNERSLRRQLDALRGDQIRSDTLHRVQELMAGKQFDKAIGVLQSYEIEFGHHADIEDLLVFAREELANQIRRILIERCTSEGRALVRDGRLDEAIHLLETGIDQTADASLSRLLQEVREQQVEFSRRLAVLQKRVTLLRERGELDEAIRLLQEHLAGSPGNSALRELLATLRAELDATKATAQAIDAANEAIRKRDFAGGLESLQLVLSAYGESPELSRAIRDLQAERSLYAQEVVGQSIESARAALLKNDPQAALACLKSATQWMEFADQQKQADWQRIGQSVKKALERAVPAAGSGAVFDEQLLKIETTKPRKMPIWAIAAAALALMGGLIWHFALGGKLVSPFSKPEPPSTGGGRPLTGPTPPPSHKGTLVIQVNEKGTNLPVKEASVYDKDALKDFTKADGSIRLHVDSGKHSIRVSAFGYADSSPISSSVAENEQQALRFELVKSAGSAKQDPTAYLSIHSTPGATVSLGNEQRGVTNSDGDLPISVPPGSYPLVLAETGYTSMSQNLTVKAGEHREITIPLPSIVKAVVQPPFVAFYASANPIVQGQSTVLNWNTSNATEVMIDQGIGGVDGSSQTTVKPQTTTTYTLTAKGEGGTVVRPVIITVSPKVLPPAITAFSASPSQIVQGQSTVLSWSTSNASEVTIDQGIGRVDGTSHAKVSPLFTTTYTLTAKGDGEPVVHMVNIDVRIAEPKIALQAAVDKYYSAFNAHDVGKIQAAWSGMTGGQAKTYEKQFKDYPKTTSTGDCRGASPVISGDTADWACTETTIVDPGAKNPTTSHHNIHFRFAKKGGEWVIVDRD